jgi:hypothetical protein
MHFWKVRCCLDVVAPSHWQPEQLGWELATLPAVTVWSSGVWNAHCKRSTGHISAAKPHLIRDIVQLCLGWHGGGMGLPLTWNKFKFTFNKKSHEFFKCGAILDPGMRSGINDTVLFWTLVCRFGMEKIRRDPGSHFWELSNNFWVQNWKSYQFIFADPDPGSGTLLTPGSKVRDPGGNILVRILSWSADFRLSFIQTRSYL